MIGEEIKDTLKELTVEELRKITWDYSEENIFGIYNGHIIRGYLWEVKECGNIHLLTVQKCNVAEGWVEYLECEILPDTKDVNQFFKEVKLKRDEETGEPIKTKVDCKVIVDLLDSTGDIIVTLS